MVSVLLSSYNPDKDKFKEAIESILKQTYNNFELIIIDDCSSIPIKNIYESFNIHDSRVSIFRNNENLGLAKSLNKGMKIAKGKYIARMDDDDICDESRFEKQVSFLEKNEKVAVVFTKAKLIDYDNGNFIRESIVTTNIKKKLIIKGNFLVHSSAMFRKDKLIEFNGYNNTFVYAQDYELWMRIIKKYDIYILDECLVVYRVPGKKSSKYKRIMSYTNTIFSQLYYVTDKNTKITDKYLVFFSILKGIIKILISN